MVHVGISESYAIDSACTIPGPWYKDIDAPEGNEAIIVIDTDGTNGNVRHCEDLQHFFPGKHFDKVICCP